MKNEMSLPLSEYMTGLRVVMAMAVTTILILLAGGLLMASTRGLLPGGIVLIGVFALIISTPFLIPAWVRRYEQHLKRYKEERKEVI